MLLVSEIPSHALEAGAGHVASEGSEAEVLWRQKDTRVTHLSGCNSNSSARSGGQELSHSCSQVPESVSLLRVNWESDAHTVGEAAQ